MPATSGDTAVRAAVGPQPAIFPGYTAPVVRRVADGERELVPGRCALGLELRKRLSPLARDVFDALTSDRVYRKAFSVEDAVQMMREQRGRHFDPVLLDAFIVRLIFIPSLMTIFGKANWYLPGWLQRVLPHVSVESEHDIEAEPAP